MQVLEGRYRLVDMLDRGGMAVVWRGFDEVLGRPVAVKVLTPECAADPDLRARVRAEARAAARLTHPNVGVVHDFGEHPDSNDELLPYVVMELIEGPSLRDVLVDGPLPWPRAASVAAQVASGLAAAHARGLVHRDVKPANVVLAPSGAKLVDFGISAVVGEEREAGGVIGTPAYVAPELLVGCDVTPAVDVYALGLLLYRSVAGRMPWDADRDTAIMRAHMAQPPAPLALTGVPDELNQLCLQCLDKDPGNRPEAAELARRLGELRGVPASWVPVPVSPPDPVQVARAQALRTDTAFMPMTTVPPRPRRSAKLPVLLALVAALALSAVVAGLLQLRQAAQISAAPTAPPARPTPAAAAVPPCQATYRTLSDDGSTFTGDLTVVNTASTPLRNWTLSFRYPGGQQAEGDLVSQTGDVVSIGPVSDELAPGQKVTYTLEGSYDGSNPMPMSFAIDRSACRTSLVGAVAGNSGKGHGHGNNNGDGNAHDTAASLSNNPPAIPKPDPTAAPKPAAGRHHHNRGHGDG